MSKSALIVIFLIGSSAWAQIPIGFIRNPCPEGYIPVPPSPGYTTENFCVMKFEAKNVGGTAKSQASGAPWTSIDRGVGPSETGSAWKACRDLGPNYDLISNDEWQTIARNIADVAANWNGGVVASSRINRGLSSGSSGQAADPTDANHCLGTASSCDANTWNDLRRTNFLSNGQVIWDINGNVSEWVKTYHYKNFNVNDYISDPATAAANDMFGNDGSCSSPTGGNYCGFGYAYDDQNSGKILRGGAFSYGLDSGIFMSITQDLIASNDKGFRCVFHPPNDLDPCAVRNSPAVGTVCKGGALYVGSANSANLMTTPSGCTNSPTPACGGGTDSLTLPFYALTPASISGTNTIDGAMNSSIAAAATVNTQAANFCENLTWGNYSDWFLPSTTELAVAQSQSALNFKTASNYWSSNQSSGSNAYVVPFPSGTTSTLTKTSYQFIRCFRKY